MVEQWKARHCNIRVGTALSSISGGSDLWEQVTEIEGIEQYAKDVELTTTEKDVESTLLLGQDANLAQNQIVEDTEPTDTEFTGTLLGNIVDLEQFMLGSGTASTGGSSNMQRYNFGTDRPAAGVAITVQFLQGTSKVNFLMNNARAIKMGGFKQEAEGAAESEFTFKCAAKDTYKEKNF